MFKLDDGHGATRREAPRARVTGWNVARLNGEALLEALADAPPPADLNLITGTAEAEQLVERTMKRLRDWCDACMPRRSNRTHRRPCYWWTNEIAEQRRVCNRLRREAQRHRRREDAEEAVAAYKTAKKCLVWMIKDSKARCWRELIDVDRDAWGCGYEIAMKRLRGPGPVGPREPHFMEELVGTLFPDHPVEERDGIAVDEIPPFTVEELMAVVSGLPGRKAPGPDGIPNEVLKVVAAEKPRVLLDMFNACLRVGLFSRSLITEAYDSKSKGGVEELKTGRADLEDRRRK